MLLDNKADVTAQGKVSAGVGGGIGSSPNPMDPLPMDPMQSHMPNFGINT